MNWARASVFSNAAGAALFVGYVVLVGVQPKPMAKAQTAYVTGTTLGMNQTACTGATSTSPRPFVTDGTTATCGSWTGATYGARITTDTSGLVTWTVPAACQHSGNAPLVYAIAEGPNPAAGVNVNVQIEGTPSATQVSFRVVKNTATTVALLGLTIAVTASGTAVGVTTIDANCTPQ